MNDQEKEHLAGPRWREVEAYAEGRGGIPFGLAIIELINRGLSHTDPMVCKAGYENGLGLR